MNQLTFSSKRPDHDKESLHNRPSIERVDFNHASGVCTATAHAAGL
jgi:hypothetical protein